MKKHLVLAFLAGFASCLFVVFILNAMGLSLGTTKSDVDLDVDLFVDESFKPVMLRCHSKSAGREATQEFSWKFCLNRGKDIFMCRMASDSDGWAGYEFCGSSVKPGGLSFQEMSINIDGMLEPLGTSPDTVGTVKVLNITKMVLQDSAEKPWSRQIKPLDIHRF